MSLRRGHPRPAAVAGMFYPGTPSALEATVHRLLADVAPDDLPDRPAALIVPHAGYIYSGPTAAIAFAAAPEAPRRVILVGPAHRVAFRGISAGDFERYECPLGALPVDRAAIAEIEARGLVTVVPEAHEDEHCLEVMVPFLLGRFGEIPIVPLLAGSCSAADVEAALDALLGDGDLLVVSSDLSHFMPYDAACERDRATLDAVLAGRWRDLGPHDACGFRGITGLMRLAERRGWRPVLLDYRNSGDTAGDRGRVVGYGAAAYVPA